jgi:hypothetical protein
MSKPCPSLNIWGLDQKPSIMSILRQRLASDKLTRYLAVIATLLSLPALFHGFEVDDRLHRIGVLRQGKLAYLGKSPLDLFTFLDGKPEFAKSLMDVGIATWWTDPHARLSFFRPISSLTIWADHQFLKNPFLMHVHSLLWYVGTIAVAVALYRRFIREAWIAGLAGFMFTVDHTHGLPVGWLAQRNTLTSGIFGLLSLYFHDRARRDEGRAREAIFAALFLGLALFCAEAALAIVPYLFAHAWTFDRPRWVRALLPFAPPLLVWLVIYKLGGYGAHGSGLYVDPGDAPLSYLANVLRHGPILVASELGLPGIDFYPFLPLYAKAGMIGFSIVGVGLFLAAIRPLLREDPVIRFFVLGGMLSVLPSCATFPSSRLTFLTSFGILGALATIVAAWRDRASWFPQHGFARWRSMPIVLWCGLGHVFLSPAVYVFSLHQMTIFEKIVARLSVGVPEDPQIESQRMVVVNPPEPAFAAYVMITRTDDGRPSPAKMLAFSSGSRDMAVTRTDASTVIVSSTIGLVHSATDLLTRDDRPFSVGDHVDLSDVSIEVTRINADGLPMEAKFMFAHPLENEAYRWMQWKNQTLVPLPPLEIGETISFPAQIIQLF